MECACYFDLLNGIAAHDCRSWRDAGDGGPFVIASNRLVGKLKSSRTLLSGHIPVAHRPVRKARKIWVFICVSPVP